MQYFEIHAATTSESIILFVQYGSTEQVRRVRRGGGLEVSIRILFVFL